MSYKNVYFDEEKQKVKWSTNKSIDVPIKMKLVGKLNRTEFDALIEFLWDVYQDNDITYKQFKKHLDSFRNFIDNQKELFK